MKALDRSSVMLGLLLLMAALLLCNCWRAPYSKVDDGSHVALALKAPWRDWFVPTYSSTYFPVTMFSYRVDHALFGSWAPRPESAAESGAASVSQKPAPPLSSAPAMRLMSGLYHLLAGFLLWKFLRRIGAGAGLAAFVALLWTGHPMACESVCWIAERKNVLCALFGFGALLAWTAERRHIWRLPLAAVLYALAGLSKPNALGLLPIFVVLELLDPPRRVFSWRTPRHWLGLAARMSPLLVISAGILLAGLYAYKMELVEPPGGSVWTALLTDTGIFARYMRNVLLPVDVSAQRGLGLALSFYYGVTPLVSLSDVRVWAYGLVLLVLCGAMIWTADREQRPLAVLGVLWFFSALGPSSNLIALPYWMQDRYAYIPAAGLLLALGVAAVGAARRLNVTGAVPFAAAAVVAAAGVCGVLRSRDFRNSDILELEAAVHQPDSAKARLSAGRIIKGLYYTHTRRAEQCSPNSDGQTRQLRTAELCARSALSHYEAAGRCPDVDRFVDPFTLRTWAAELLVGLHEYDQARQLLGPLPPPGLQMLPDTTADGRTILRNRTKQFACYPPRTLASAWLIAGEADLREANAGGGPTQRRLELAARAQHDADESLRYAKLDDEAYVLKARALVSEANAYAAQNDMPAARGRVDKAIEVLKSVPESSPSANTAQSILKNLQSSVGRVDNSSHRGP